MPSRPAWYVVLSRVVPRAAVVIAITVSCPLHAAIGPVPPSLKGIPVPPVPGLFDGPDPIIVNKEKALVLGKALFWDTNVGSDGTACATCHFHAGADARTKNQFAPQGGTPATINYSFDPNVDGAPRGPNAQLRKSDFPFHRFLNTDPLNPAAGAAVYSTDDVVGSAGTFSGEFRSVTFFETAEDDCLRAADPVFHVGSIGTRRVTHRNAPSVINAVFNFRSFWDGAANNVFNGSSQWGDRDPDAGVWVKVATDQVVRQRLNLINSSLASQAVAPPVNVVEMACAGRRFADLGRKLMFRRPLERQNVHWNDSVLGLYAFSTPGNLKPGLKTRYVDLVRAAFNHKYWSYSKRGPFGAPKMVGGEVPLPYNQFEANFGMFFALAIQVYESTLISDDAPYDRSARDAQGIPIELSAAELRGLEEFRTAHCGLCHIGPTFSAAAVYANAEVNKVNPAAFSHPTFTISATHNVVTRIPTNRGHALVDTGFSATGVVAPTADLGLAGTDPFGNPLSFSDQYLQLLAGNQTAVVDAPVLAIRPCDFDFPLALNVTKASVNVFTQVDGIIPQAQDTAGCRRADGAFLPAPAVAAAELAKPDTRKMLSATEGVFKIPMLRNVELTGPYMHNGGMATLEQVLEFYTRGGNIDVQFKQFNVMIALPDLVFDSGKRADIIAFLKSLTDERVRFERAPFDHPEITIPAGHSGDHQVISATHPLGALLAGDALLVIPAVGADGRSEPLQPFDALLAP